MGESEAHIVVFDTETTGLKPVDQHRIIELTCQRGLEDGSPLQTWRIKPDVPISPGAQAIHGISAEDLADCPSFSDVADEIWGWLEPATVIVGYNVAFDIAFLESEFGRAGRDVDLATGRTIVDPFKLWQAMEPRSLVAAHGRFAPTGSHAFDRPHSAEEDVRATARVLTGMVKAFDLESESWNGLAGKCFPPHWIGPSRHIQWQSRVAVIGFGKHEGEPVFPLAKRNPGYISWMRDGDFPRHVRSVAHGALTMDSEDAFHTRLREFYPPPSDS